MIVFVFLKMKSCFAEFQFYNFNCSVVCFMTLEDF